VTLVCLTGPPVSSSIEGSLSLMRCSLPMISPLSSEYLAVCFFIKLLAFAPISGANDSNAVAALDEAHRDNSALAGPDAKQTRFLFTVSFVYRDNSERIEKSALRFHEADSMFG